MVTTDSGDRSALARIRLTIGNVDISSGIASGEVKRSVDNIGTATFEVSSDVIREKRPNYHGEVKAFAIADDVESALFTGVVARVDVGLDDQVTIYCEDRSAIIRDARTGLLIHEAVHVNQLIELLLKDAGLPVGSLQVQGEVWPPTEVEHCEFVVPITNLSLTDDLEVWGVELTPNRAAEPFRRLVDESPAKAALLESATYARVRIDATRLTEAEDQACRRIDLALAWLALRASDGSPIKAGRVRPFFRSLANVLPARAPLVALSTRSGALWVHSPGTTGHRANLDLDPGTLGYLEPRDETLRTGSDEGALLAWYRSRSGGSLTERIQALWDCLEFYAAPVSPPPKISRTERKSIVDALADVPLTSEARSRLTQVLGQLNSAPLMSKVAYGAALDGHPLTEGEVTTLRILRKARNDLSHGGEAPPSRTEDLAHGLSIVARLLAARAAQVSPDV